MNINTITSLPNTQTNTYTKLASITPKTNTDDYPEFKFNPDDLARYDSIEISPIGRELSSEAIIHHSAVYFGTVEINHSLTSILENKSEAVRDTTYKMIENNFINAGKYTEEQRSELRELGLAQAKYIANNFMSEDEAKEFMDTMYQIAKIATTGKADEATGKITYTTPPQKPIGAPDGYIKTSDIMKALNPEEYEKFKDDIANGKDNWVSTLMEYRKKYNDDPVMQQRYNQKLNEINSLFEKISIKSRFNITNDFYNDISDQISSDSFEHKDILQSNLDSFMTSLQS